MHASGSRHQMPGVVYQDRAALDRYVALGVLTRETLASVFRDVAARNPNRTALSDAEWSCTYQELDELTDRAGAAFLALGLRPLDRVIFQLPNIRELVVALVGCFKAGLIPICTLAAHRRLEIGYIGKHAEAVAHFVAEDTKFDYLAFSRELRAEIPTLRHTVVLRGPGAADAPTLQSLIAAQDLAAARRALAAVELDPFQVALFQLSGGTTGIPKIIPRFHNEYVYTVRTVVEFHGLDEATVAYTPNPMMHNAPMACIWMPALFTGGEVTVCASLDAAVLGPFLERRRPNWMFVPPPVLIRLKDAGWIERAGFARSKGFSTASGAAKLSALIGNAPTWPLFGMTEGLLCYCNASDPTEARNGTVGRPLSEHDEVKLLRPASEEGVDDGEIGELAVRGPCTVRGYYDAADRDAVAFTSDGFYRSGDLMRIRVIDGVRYLVFEGRVKDVVDRGGEKINCEEVERISVGHPDIAAISVVAMPDPLYGQRACAFVIPITGRAPPTVGGLGAYLETQGMAKFKWPERIEIVSEFPLTTSGKLSKPRLREAIERILADQAGATREMA